MENLLERKKNGQIKGLISHMWLIFLNTVQPVIPNVCTKFQNPRSSSSREIFDENFHIHYLGVRDRKRENRKKAKINLSTLVLFSVIHLVVLIVYTKFKEPGSNKN